MKNLVLLLSYLTALGPWTAFAQPQSPPPPPKYRAVVRYRITAPRDQHVVLYDAMTRHLQNLDFTFDPPLSEHPATDREDRSKNYLTGFVPSDQFRKVLDNPSTVSLLIMPVDFDYPARDIEQRVRVRLELVGGLALDRQREMADQTRAVLGALAFQEAPGYDHRGYSGRAFTRLVGTIPAGRLEVLLKDLRDQPAGWFAPRVAPQDVPLPLREINPIRVIEVLNDPEPIVQIKLPEPRSPDFLEKISADLWTLLADKSSAQDVLRIELIFVGTITAQDQGWKRMLEETAPGIFVEGQLGPIVTALVRRGQVKALAALATVSTLRLPRLPDVEVETAPKELGDNDKALSLSGLGALHRKGYRGQGVRLAILDTDFSGWQNLVVQKKLPAHTHLIDLTSLYDADLQPAAARTKPDILGHGTLCALAATLAAPGAELCLVRLDGSAPHQIEEIARALKSGILPSTYLDRRRDELVTARAELDFLRSMVQRERSAILESYRDEIDLANDFGFLGPVYGWIFSPRAWSRARVAYVERLEKALTDKNRRFFKLVEDIHTLRATRIVASPLAWNDGFPLGGASPLSRALDRLLAPSQGKSSLLWFQAAGDTRGQVWSGLFHDEDGNGLMEFASPGYTLKKGQWTTELNFLAWKPFGQEQTQELPAGTRLHAALQWREPHDADYYLRDGEEDSYRKPLADLRLHVLRQRDPGANLLPADAFDLAAVSFGIPERLEHQPGGSVYRIVLETILTKAGRYALRLERPRGARWFLLEEGAEKRPSFARTRPLEPTGLRPLGAATLPAVEKRWELQTRLFVDAIGPERLTGRPVLADFATDQGSVGLPGDARAVITVGAADWQGRPRPYSAGGPLAFAELARKPDVLAFDGLRLKEAKESTLGTGIAACFAAGHAAALMSSGISADEAVKNLKLTR